MSYFGRSFYENIAAGAYSNRTPWSKIGWTPTMDGTESDLWSKAGVYTFPSAAGQMEVLSSNNTTDIGTVIKGSLTVPITSDAGGSTTTLLDADVDFTAATAVEVGDCLVLDPSGTTPEWGYVTAVAAHQLTCAGGFSSGGTGSSRVYFVVDKNGGGTVYTGAHVVKVDYLTDALAQKTIILPLNGTTAVPTRNAAGAALSDLYRINSFRVIATGSTNKPAGNLTIQGFGGGTTYSYITLGFTRARNIAYTVPAGKTLYVVEMKFGFGLTGNGKVEYCRMWTRANREPATGFCTGSLFYAYTGVVLGNGEVPVTLPIPTKLPACTDIKVSGIASAAGVASCALRGFLETA